MTRRDAIVAAARRCVGARFRTHGRDPAFGLDCVGVAAIAFGREVPGDYPLRGGSPDCIALAIERAGLARRAVGAPGDLALVEAGPGQLHLAILTGRGFVHADAGLRRVVEAPGVPPERVIGVWGEEG